MGGGVSTASEDGAHGVIGVAGEALVDFVQAGPDRVFEALPGGSPANVAVGIARLGVSVRMIARISDDLLGRWIREHLNANGVDLAYAVHAHEPSSLAVAAIEADGTAEYEFRVDNTADWQWRDEELDLVVDERLVALHSGSLALALAPGATVLARLLDLARQTATISYDPNCRPLLMGSPEAALRRVQRMLRIADVVKTSAEDIEWLLPGATPDEVAQEWLSRGPAFVVVTLGTDGALAVGRRAGPVRSPGLRVDVVDTVGAGDAFTSALLASLHRRSLLGATRRDALGELTGDELTDVLDEAVLASAITCTRRGAEPPTLDELSEGSRLIER